MQSNLLARGYWAQHDYEEAIAQLNKSIESSPNAPITHYNLYALYSARLMYDDAVPQLRRALMLEGRELDANAVDASYNRYGYKGLLQTMIQLHSNPSPREYYPARVAES